MDISLVKTYGAHYISDDLSTFDGLYGPWNS